MSKTTQTNNFMKKQDIIDAYCHIRTIDQTIPDDVLDFMKEASIEKLTPIPLMDVEELNDIIQDYNNNLHTMTLQELISKLWNKAYIVGSRESAKFYDKINK